MICVLTTSLFGFPSYQSKVPNGAVNGQSTGHGGPYPFRWAFRDNGYVWDEALCMQDTDGDGQTNGHELGDPCCIWSMGETPAFTNDISIAGDPSSMTSRPAVTCPSPPSAPSPPPPSPLASPSPSPPPSPSLSPPPPPSSGPSPPPIHPPPSPPPTDTCSETHEYIVAGAGAGGSVAAAYLREHGASFTWFEAGGNENARLQTHPAVDPNSLPTNMWSPTVLRTTTGRTLPYQIPLGAGGMTLHYMGVSYWTRSDTVRSLQMLPHEMEALEFVVNRTLKDDVYCDTFNANYHTHSRVSVEPATEANVSSLPMCLYGRCNASTCRLNDYMAATIGLVGAETEWYRQSSYLEYPGDDVRLHHRVVGLKMNGTRVSGVYVETSTGTFLSCASRAVLLAAGVMGNAHILSESYQFFAQPVVVYVDGAVVAGHETCDADSISGGTLHHPRFLSTFAICTVDGVKRLLYATPQAINNNTTGTVDIVNGTFVATVNYDDPTVYETLWSDLEQATTQVLGAAPIVRPSDARVMYASYHWTGDASSVYRSRYRAYDNLFLADAMAVVGTTSGWTSFNARVAGAVAALRAINEGGDYTCASTVELYAAHCCHVSDDTCEAMRTEYQGRGCCLNE